MEPYRRERRMVKGQPNSPLAVILALMWRYKIMAIPAVSWAGEARGGSISEIERKDAPPNPAPPADSSAAR
jgi:hypothetical protein